MHTRSLHIEIARQHLAALDDPNASHIFVCIPEAPDARGGVRHVFGPLEVARDRLEAEQRAGCGVFVTVNAMRGRRRLKAEVSRVRALWIERDGPGPDLPLTPSLVVETSPGKRHEYLLLRPDAPLDPAEAVWINRDIARTFAGDRQATDVARALRLAGSWHLKAKPHQVGLSDQPIVKYPAHELKAAFPAAPQSSAVRHPNPVPAHRRRYLSVTVAGVCADLAHAAEGTRNHTLNRSAFRLGRLGLDLAEIDAVLTPVALSIGLSEPETAATIRSGARAGGQHPGLPPRE